MPGDSDEAVRIRDMSPADARLVATWRYEGPWSVYDGGDPAVTTTANGYHAIVAAGTGEFLGYVCVGAEARVPGLGEEPGVADVGFGLDPRIVGRGRGRSLVGPALEWVEDRYGAPELRAVVQAWNERSLRLCRSLGFVAVGRHQAPQAGGVVDYVVLRRPARELRLAGSASSPSGAASGPPGSGTTPAARSSPGRDG